MNAEELIISLHLLYILNKAFFHLIIGPRCNPSADFISMPFKI